MISEGVSNCDDDITVAERIVEAYAVTVRQTITLEYSRRRL